MLGWIKGTLMPGSVMLLLLGVIGGALLLMFERTRTWGRRWIVALGMAYWVLSMPVAADGLAALVAGGLTPLEPGAAADAKAIVVLDGGAFRYRIGGVALEVVATNTALRAVEAARIYRWLDRPVVIVTSGSVALAPGPPEGTALVEALVRAGVPEDRVQLDSTSPDTRAHAVNVGALLRRHGVSRFVLVTSATHLRRSLLAFRQAGLDPIPSAAALRSADDLVPAWRRWLPDVDSLWISEQAIYDCVGLTYYWIRGWV